MQDFVYAAPRTLDEARAVLAGANGDARVLAGGTDLLVQLREGRRRAGLVVDIKQIAEANVLSYDPSEGLQIGAAVPCFRIMDYLEAAGLYPGLAAAVGLIGGTQIQGRATLGGNLCNASPAADAIPALIVHRAAARLYGPDGYREVAAEDFCTAPGQTVMTHGEFLVGMRLPPVGAGFGAHYLRFTPRNEMDIAVAGAAAALELDLAQGTIRGARIALSAVAPTPLWVVEAGDYLAGRLPTEESFAEAARLAQLAVRPIDDMRGTAVQRRHLAGVLTRRALKAAALQALQAIQVR
jgi:carbon-monoxide dehydrogenase medium subunit